MDYLRLAAEFVDAHFHLATVAVVAGSTARGNRTATSDIDLLLIGPPEMFEPGRASLAANFAFGGEAFEVFAYTPASFAHWASSDVGQYRPVLITMLLTGIAIREGAALTELRRTWAQVIDAGPTISGHDLDLRRYATTDLIDDLRDAADPLEQRIISAMVYTQTAELMLLTNGQWLATGKHLPRAQRAWDADRADALATAFLTGDPGNLVAAAERELDAAGGRLQTGFVR